MISLLFFVLYFDGTKEYYKRIQNSTVVVGKVVNSTYKEREVIEVDLDDVAYTTTESYYLIEVEYEFQNAIYQWTYESEMDVSVGHQEKLHIDTGNPQNVLHSNSAEIFLGLGVLFFIVFILVVIFFVFKMKAILILFGLGVLGFWAVAIQSALMANALAIIWFIAGFAFLGAFWVYYKLLK